MHIKKIIGLLLLLVAAGTCFSQRVKRKGTTPIDVSKDKRRNLPKAPQFTTEQFVGKWQEVTRIDKSNNPVDFTDTIYLNFLTADKVITRDGKSANMAGNVNIEQPGNVLIAAADVYSIISVTDSQAVLDNQEGLIHRFKKTDQFIYETYGKLILKNEEYTEPVSVQLTDVMGNWMVYRKSARPGVINPPVNIVQYLKITDSTGENTAKGEVTFYQTNKSTQLPCNIKLTNAGIDIAAGEYTWSFFVYKADKKELVFGDVSVLLYYAKPFNRFPENRP